MTFIIEKNVPIPTTTRGRPAIYPWQDMEVGDSFFAPAETNILLHVAGRAGARLGRKFVTKMEEGGVRAWRVE